MTLDGIRNSCDVLRLIKLYQLYKKYPQIYVLFCRGMCLTFKVWSSIQTLMSGLVGLVVLALADISFSKQMQMSHSGAFLYHGKPQEKVIDFLQSIYLTSQIYTEFLCNGDNDNISAYKKSQPFIRFRPDKKAEIRKETSEIQEIRHQNTQTKVRIERKRII